MSQLTLVDTKLHVVEHGAGAPLLFVHGTLEDYRAWKPQTDFFSHAYRTLAYSRRYHYPNAARGDETDYAPTLHARDLLALLDALNIDRAHVVGASYGAYIALTFATQHAARVRSLVLAEPPLIPWLLENAEAAVYARAFYERAWKPTGEAFARGETEAALKVFVDGVNRPGTFARLDEATRAVLAQNARALKIETQSPDYFLPLSESDVAALAMPVLLLGAQHSPAHFGLILDRLQQVLPHARRVTISRTGHAMNLGNAKMYNETVHAFLQNVA